MEIQWKKHVRIICDLEVGDKVKTEDWGPQLDGKVHTVEEVIPNIGHCESGFQVKISGYPNPLDSNWLNKIPKQNG